MFCCLVFIRSRIESELDSSDMCLSGCLKVVAPYDAEDCRGLLKAAVRDPDPVVFLENEILYGQKFPVTPQILDHDYTLPLDKAKIMREGVDVTLIGFGKMVGYNLQAADLLAQEGISCEVSINGIFRNGIDSPIRW